MKQPSVGLVLFLVALVSASGAVAKTTLHIASDPPGARFKCENLGKSGTTNRELEIPKTAFAGARSMTETVVFEKDGFDPIRQTVSVLRGRKNSVRVKLEPVDTSLTITSTPPGAEVTLSAPLMGTQTFTTPYEFRMTTSAARRLSGAVAVRRAFLEGYLADPSWVNRSLVVPPNQVTTVNIPFAPLLTTLEVITDPEGADIEDIEPSGFGYLGTAPLKRSFTYEDLRLWAEKRRVFKAQGAEPVLQNVTGFEAIQLTLRISKAGYEDTFLRGISIPVGESRSFHRSLSQRVEQVRFMSDPPGAHVFVLRFTVKDIYDERTGALRQQRVNEEKYLGTTPFTYNIDPSDPLAHGERLIFRKSGRQDQVIQFSAGETTYFVVM